MVVNQFNWLDFPNLFFNELVGSVTLAFFIGVLVILWIGIKNNIGTHGLIGLSILWAFAVVSYASNTMVLVVVGLIVSILYYGVISKYMTR